MAGISTPSKLVNHCRDCLSIRKMFSDCNNMLRYATFIQYLTYYLIESAMFYSFFIILLVRLSHNIVLYNGNAEDRRNLTFSFFMTCLQVATVSEG